jgi:nitrate/TMAO reductase-like tetraheme cytochrome c subunit
MAIRRKGKTAFVIVVLAAVVLGSAIVNTTEHATTARAQAALVVKEFKGVKICIECHDLTETTNFHYLDKIIAIEEKKGLRRRICVDCHGPAGNDPDSQMTDPKSILWDEDGKYYKVKSYVVHAIHQEKLEREVMECETCHLIEDNDPTRLGNYPEIPKTVPGHIIICQMCHLPSDPGNYIGIHIIYGHQECTTCHTGDMKEVHKRATAELGKYELFL